MINIAEKIQSKILVIGDLIIDNYLWGECNRVSPEAPVQVINIKKETKLIGGAGNVAHNLVTLGCNVNVLSVIGVCDISSQLRELFKEINLNTDYLIEQKDRITSKKTRIISSQQQVIRYDIESDEDINKDSERKLLNLFKSIVNNFDLIILSDYGKGVLTQTITQDILNISNLNGIKVIVDPKGKDYSKYTGAYLLTPNKKEASEATGIEIKDNVSLEKALITLKKNCNLQISLITLSEGGIAIYDKKMQIYPTVARDVFDVTGAGDTVIASLGYILSKYTNIEDAVKFSNLAAGVVVGKIGSSTTNLEEIISYESSLHLSECSEHIISFDQINEIVENYRLQNKKIVFTNGCFDIIHIGHVKYLEKSKKMGDILIVGINSDESVKKLKGSSRPINHINDRACIIAALESVDYVVPFDEDTPANLIKIIKPDVLTKGSDYKIKNIAGREFAREIKLIEFIDDKSTSSTIEKIRSL